MSTKVCSYTLDYTQLLQFLYMIFHTILCDIIYIRSDFFATCIRMIMNIFNDCNLHFRQRLGSCLGSCIGNIIIIRENINTEDR